MHYKLFASLLFLVLCAATSNLWGQNPEVENSDMGIPLGYKVVALKISDDDPVGGLIDKGSYVDILATGRKSRQLETIVRKVLIYSDPESAKNGSGTRIVALLVTAQDAQRVISAKKHGTIKLVLRGDGEEPAPEVPVIHSSTNQPTGAERSLLRTDTVRKIACDLDRIAAELESIEMYERADELRSHSQNLRLDVR